ncbi:MAG TPA: biotin transporter BioY [Terriglobales bacterium]|nr:biotin transporter BioY [Terriglobales bacterium]
MLVISGSLLVALAARISLPLPFTPVPLTLQNFAVLLVGLLLGRRAGFAALVLYLAEGATGLPVFTPVGLGGIAQLLGPTGGYLMAYPVVAYLAGWIAERDRSSFARSALAATAAEIFLFIAGVNWLMVFFHVPLVRAAQFGLYPFFFAEVMKVLLAAGIASRRPFARQARA